jgi:predicted ester cyclase
MDLAGGHSVVQKVVRAYRRAFSQMQVDVKILVTAKKRIAWQRTIKAIHHGAFQGFPATGRPIVWRDMLTTEFRDGLIAEDWVITDLAERLLLARKR